MVVDGSPTLFSLSQWELGSKRLKAVGREEGGGGGRGEANPRLRQTLIGAKSLAESNLVLWDRSDHNPPRSILPSFLQLVVRFLVSQAWRPKIIAFQR